MHSLGAVLDELRLARPLATGATLGQLARRWPEVVGERLAAECVPAGLVGGTLTVAATSAGWAAQLQMLAPEVRRRANEVLGRDAVKAVRLTVRDRSAR